MVCVGGVCGCVGGVCVGCVYVRVGGVCVGGGGGGGGGGWWWWWCGPSVAEMCLSRSLHACT